MEKEIKIMVKLYQCRDTAKRFYKEDYLNTLKPYQQILTAVSKENNIEILEALIKCLTAVAENGFQMLLFNAAAVEMIEPSK